MLVEKIWFSHPCPGTGIWMSMSNVAIAHVTLRVQERGRWKCHCCGILLLISGAILPLLFRCSIPGSSSWNENACELGCLSSFLGRSAAQGRLLPHRPRFPVVGGSWGVQFAPVLIPRGSLSMCPVQACLKNGALQKKSSSQGLHHQFSLNCLWKRCNPSSASQEMPSVWQIIFCGNIKFKGRP